MDDDYTQTAEELRQRCLGVYYLDGGDYTEIWQIVLDKDGRNARVVPIHDYAEYDSEEEMQAALAQSYPNLRMEGITTQSEPHALGFKKINAAYKKEASRRLEIMYQRTNHLHQLQNEMDASPFKSADLKDMISVIKKMDEKQYAEYARQEIESIEKDTFREMPEQEARQLFGQFCMMDAKDEIFFREQDIQKALENDTVFRGINFNL